MLEEGLSNLETSSAYSLSIEASAWASAAAFSLKPLSMLYASFCSWVVEYAKLLGISLMSNSFRY
jgi:hypothetical protein